MITVTIDTREVISKFKDLVLHEADLVDILRPMSFTVANKQKQDVPVDTAATKTSIMPFEHKRSNVEVVDDIGPQTDYAPSIEYGIKSKPSYPIQPFVRTSVYGYVNRIVRVGKIAFNRVVMRKWLS